jgi:hypothetical protein
MAGKIHEIIAVEKDVRGTAAKIITETAATFSKKAHLFSTHAKVYEALNEKDLERPADDETPQPITTVGEKLQYFESHLTRLFDVILQKEDANTKAREDIIVYIDETPITLVEKVPVQALVQLENIIEQIRKDVYDNIPTLDPTKNWFADAAAGDGKFKSDVTTRQSTKKVPKVITLPQATDKFPTQHQVYNEDVPNGVWKITSFSGMVSPAEKSKMLRRLELVLEGIRKARSRANGTEVDGKLKIGKRLFQFIEEGK